MVEWSGAGWMTFGALVSLPNASTLLAGGDQAWSLDWIANVAGAISGLAMFLIGAAILLEVGEFTFG